MNQRIKFFAVQLIHSPKIRHHALTHAGLGPEPFDDLQVGTAT